jgi:predicted RNase H-like nuclease (RuvC/YqgF family)
VLVGVYLQHQIHEHSKAAALVLEDAHRRYRSQAAEVVMLRNELKKAYLGDNPGWERDKLKLDREIKELKRTVRRLQDENSSLRQQLEQFGEAEQCVVLNPPHSLSTFAIIRFLLYNLIDLL